MDEHHVACATCRLKAAKVSNPDGTVWWSHPYPVDHEVVPVQLPPKDIIYVCDFCLTPHPKWAIPLTMPAHTRQWSVSLGAYITGLDTDAWWAACDICVALIGAGKKKELRDQALAIHQKYVPGMTAEERQSILLQLNAFWAASPGPAIEASLLDD